MIADRHALDIERRYLAGDKSAGPEYGRLVHRGVLQKPKKFHTLANSWTIALRWARGRRSSQRRQKRSRLHPTKLAAWIYSLLEHPSSYYQRGRIVTDVRVDSLVLAEAFVAGVPVEIDKLGRLEADLVSEARERLLFAVWRGSRTLPDPERYRLRIRPED